jgi:Tol biopolymer transport system component
MAVQWNRPFGLWIISLEPYSEISLQSGYIFPFGWSPDGKYVYATRGETGREIVTVQVSASNEVTSLLSLDGDVTEPDDATLSPDGKEIIVSVGEEKSDVWLMEGFDPSARASRPQP